LSVRIELSGTKRLGRPPRTLRRNANRPRNPIGAMPIEFRRFFHENLMQVMKLITLQCRPYDSFSFMMMSQLALSVRCIQCLTDRRLFIMSHQNRPGTQAPSREGMQEHKQGQTQQPQRDKNPSNPSRDNQKQANQNPPNRQK
jgi:hypothetical protein